MIAKILKSGGTSRRLIDYLLSETNTQGQQLTSDEVLAELGVQAVAHEGARGVAEAAHDGVHVNPRVIAGSDDLHRLQRMDAKTLSKYLDAPIVDMADEHRVYHFTVAIGRQTKDRPGEQLDDATWRRVAEDMVGRLGFSECRWTAISHAAPGEDHMHVVVTRATEDGRRVSDPYRSRMRLRDACEHWERELDLQKTGRNRSHVSHGRGVLPRQQVWDRQQRRLRARSLAASARLLPSPPREVRQWLRLVDDLAWSARRSTARGHRHQPAPAFNHMFRERKPRGLER